VALFADCEYLGANAIPSVAASIPEEPGAHLVANAVACSEDA
jgi:hypothetical protein